jgi:hypothetical protein
MPAPAESSAPCTGVGLVASAEMVTLATALIGAGAIPFSSVRFRCVYRVHVLPEVLNESTPHNRGRSAMHNGRRVRFEHPSRKKEM